MDPIFIKPPIVIVHQQEIGIHKDKGDFYDKLVIELSISDLIRNFPTMIRETKQETIEAVSEYLRSQENKELCVMRRDGFNVITSLTYVGDAEATAPTGTIFIVKS